MFLEAWFSTRDAETGGLLQVWFQASLEYRVRPVFKKEEKRNIDLYSFGCLSPETADVKEQHMEENTHNGNL